MGQNKGHFSKMLYIPYMYNVFSSCHFPVGHKRCFDHPVTIKETLIKK